MAGFETRQIPRQHTAVIRSRSPMQDIGPAIGQALGELWMAIEQAGLAPSGPPFVRYLEMSEGTATFECGFPVPRVITGSGAVEPGSIGGVEAACMEHIGPYQRLGQTWDALTAWVAEQGRVPSGPGWEVYVDDPGTVPEATLRTELYLPIG
jgi:effector-binding domain-containing protein